MHIIQLLISMSVVFCASQADWRQLHQLLVCRWRPWSELACVNNFKVYTVHSIIALFANTCIYKCILWKQCNCDTAGQFNTFTTPYLKFRSVQVAKIIIVKIISFTFPFESRKFLPAKITRYTVHFDHVPPIEAGEGSAEPSVNLQSKFGYSDTIHF